MYVIVAGGGKVGSNVTRSLVDLGHEVTMIEQRPDRFARLEEEFGPVVIRGDATEIAVLERAGLARPPELLLAVTGDDEDNLVISQIAKESYGVRKAIARVNDPRNTWLFTEAWGIDTAVSTPSLLASSALESVASGALIRLQSFQNGRVRLSSVIVQEEHPARDRAIRDLELPMGANVAAIIREGVVVPPDPDQIVGIGDELLLILEAEVEEEVAEVLIGSAVVMGDVGDLPDRDEQ